MILRLLIIALIAFPLFARAQLDPAFAAPLTIAPRTLVVQPDGKILLAALQTFTSPDGSTHRGLARLDPDGSLDATFNPRGGIEDSGFISDLLLQPDGKILVIGSFARLAGVTLAFPGYARLNPDGSLDATFTPSSHPSAHLIVLADNRTLHATFANNVLTLTRHTTAGALDPGYSPLGITLAPPVVNAVNDPNYTMLVSTRAPDGRLLVAAVSVQQVGTGVFSRNESQLFVLAPDGTLAPDGFRATLPFAITQLAAAGDKLHYASSTRTGPLGSVRTQTLGRLNADSMIDRAYAPLSFKSQLSEQFPLVAFQTDGSALIALTGSLARYDRDGRRDLDFVARPALTPAFARFDRLISVADGRVLVTGNFTHIDATPVAFLARLVPDLHASATRLLNLSVRQAIVANGEPLIVGFVVNGAGTTNMLVRGIGPALAAFGISQPLADPRLTVFTGSSAVLANENWSDDPDAAPLLASSAAAVGAFALAPNSRDAAARASLISGAHTLHVAGSNSTTGIALAEAYVTDAAPADFRAARIVNISARGEAGTGDATLIAGFTIGGTGSKRLLIRAAGPALAAFGVTTPLADPSLTLYSGNTVIASNDNWSGDITLRTAAETVAAFPFDSDSRDAALLITLAAGSYTVQVSGANNTTGTALIEIYELP